LCRFKSGHPHQLISSAGRAYDDEPTVSFRAGQLPAEFDLMP
jgi:hypothetical protein